jgi:hypothetical protein
LKFHTIHQCQVQGPCRPQLNLELRSRFNITTTSDALYFKVDLHVIPLLCYAHIYTITIIIRIDVDLVRMYSWHLYFNLVTFCFMLQGYVLYLKLDPIISYQLLFLYFVSWKFYHFNRICSVILLKGAEDGPLGNETSHPHLLLIKEFCFDCILSLTAIWRWVRYCSNLPAHVIQIIKCVETDVFVWHSPEWRWIKTELKFYNALKITRIFVLEKELRQWR